MNPLGKQQATADWRSDLNEIHCSVDNIRATSLGRCLLQIDIRPGPKASVDRVTPADEAASRRGRFTRTGWSFESPAAKIKLAQYFRYHPECSGAVAPPGPSNSSNPPCMRSVPQ
jgi:hypothetical protein